VISLNSDINQSINQSLIPFTDIAKGGFQRNASNASADQSGYAMLVKFSNSKNKSCFLLSLFYHFR